MDLKNLTYEINGAIFEVNRVLGSGFLERVYENALVIELQSRGLCVEKQKPVNVYYKDEIVGEYIADIIVEQQVILELKAQVDLGPTHKAQLLHYLKATGIQIGLLVNFTYPKAIVQRVVLELEE